MLSTSFFLIAVALLSLPKRCIHISTSTGACAVEQQDWDGMGEAISLSHTSKPPRCAVCGFAAACELSCQKASQNPTFLLEPLLLDPSSSLALPISTYTFLLQFFSICPTHCILRLRQSETPKEVSHHRVTRYYFYTTPDLTLLLCAHRALVV